MTEDEFVTAAMDKICECPRCGRLHNHLRAGKPPHAEHDTQIRLLAAAARAYVQAVQGLSKIGPDGKTLFEGSPTKDQECFEAWKRLNDQGVLLAAALDLVGKTP
ncbi:MAG: hypothetical protein KGL39_07435 [Patescibacteria group bacterium]|nr:hypothetical protein [Patescibacteria group bacterium]